MNSAPIQGPSGSLSWPLDVSRVCVRGLHTKLTVIFVEGNKPELQCLEDLSGFDNSNLSVSAVCTTSPSAFT